MAKIASDATERGRGLPQPDSCRRALKGTTNFCHCSESVSCMPKSLAQAPHTPPSGSVFLSGNLMRTLLVLPGPFLAKKDTPLYFEASNGPLGSVRFKPM